MLSNMCEVTQRGNENGNSESSTPNFCCFHHSNPCPNVLDSTSSWLFHNLSFDQILTLYILRHYYVQLFYLPKWTFEFFMLKKRIKSSNIVLSLKQSPSRLLKISKGDGNCENNEDCSIRKACPFQVFCSNFSVLISQGKTSHDFQVPSEEASRAALNRDPCLMPKLMEGSWPFSRQLCAILIRRSPAAVG